tara:strand:- start:264 stop:533 length:270 start_codon:yes stop_codon:yes gene_type:complete
MKYSDKEKAALAYHERLHEMYAIMESKRRKPMKKLKDIDREQISDQTKLYALLGAAQVSAASASVFTWLGKRCDAMHTYFLAKSAHYRR